MGQDTSLPGVLNMHEQQKHHYGNGFKFGYCNGFGGGYGSGHIACSDDETSTGDGYGYGLGNGNGDGYYGGYRYSLIKDGGRGGGYHGNWADGHGFAWSISNA
jgi:hypothetical protein